MSIIIIILAIISAIFLIICYFKWPTVEHYIAVLWKELGKPYMLYMLNVSIKKVILKYFLAVTTICSCNGLSKLFVTITVENDGKEYKTLLGIDTATIDILTFGIVTLMTLVVLFMIYLEYKKGINKYKQLDKTCIVMYAAQIANDTPLLSYNMACKAIENKYAPSDGSPIRIPIELERKNISEDLFWKEEDFRLRNKVRNLLFPYLQTAGIQHISLFALAPMPLLVRLGTLLNEKLSVDVFQKHRSPDNWNRLHEPAQDFLVNEPAISNRQPVLVFSLSDNIKDRIDSLYGDNASIWEVTVPNPNMDMLRTNKQQEEFRKIIRELLSRISHASSYSVINVHMAMPAALAIEFGRVWMPKAHKSLRLFDFRNNRENETLTIIDE